MLDRRRRSDPFRARDRNDLAERLDLEVSTLDRISIDLWNRAAPLFERSLGRLRARAAAVTALEPGIAALSDAALQASVAGLRPRLVREGLRPGLVETCFAHFREMARRRIGLRHHDVQVMGALALIEGRLVEMQTGEGKTIVAALAAATAALAGIPTHVVTVNDYLAQRDADIIRPILGFAGLQVGAVQHGQDAAERRALYRADVTYVSNKELAFDYLRDRVAHQRGGRADRDRRSSRTGQTDRDGPMLRGLHFAIVDEADSILMDEARTPLILANPQPADGAQDVYRTALDIAAHLVAHAHFTVDARAQQVHLTGDGSDFLAASVAGRPGPWRARHAREDLIRHALAARHLYRANRDYVVAGGTVQIVDEHTGRIAEGRSWQHGLHQMIETLEGVAPSERHATEASITYQSFFRRYLKLAGMSGTLSEVAAEARDVYALKTVRIPTHRTSRRIATGLRPAPNAHAKWDAVVSSARVLSAAGRPVLIGTRSVSSSEVLSSWLRDAGLAHVVLNARNDREEAGIVGEAGQAGRITVATNMAGRGTDIRLDHEALAAGGLHVILTEVHESRRIDRQLIGRGGRQGDPSSFEVFASLDDDLFRTHARAAAFLIGKLSGRSDWRQRAGCAALRWWVQQAIERRHRRIRQRLFQSRHETERLLSFADRH